MPTWKLLDTGANTGAYNMALDEELLARAQAGESAPVLRLYTWDPPAVSLGRFQERETAVNEEACRKLGFDIVRRVTGGRAVLHSRELTYSVISRTDNPLFPQDIPGTYKVIAAALVAGLRHLAVPAEMVSREGRHAQLVQRKPKAASCFSSPSWYEIVVNNRKIIGSAQRRVSGAFLQHGSILIDYDAALERSVIPGGAGGDTVTCVNRVLEKVAPLQEIKQAILLGFSESLPVQFE
jgi:lipoate-protein ligase A